MDTDLSMRFGPIRRSPSCGSRGSCIVRNDDPGINRRCLRGHTEGGGRGRVDSVHHLSPASDKRRGPSDGSIRRFRTHHGGTETTEKAVCSVPVRAYLRVTRHGPRLGSHRDAEASPRPPGHNSILFSRQDARIAKVEHFRFESSRRSWRLDESRPFRAPRLRALDFKPGCPVFSCFPRPLSRYSMKRRRSGWRFRHVGRVGRGRDELDRCASSSVGRNRIESNEDK